MIFFTRVYTGRYTLHEKSTIASPKILLLLAKDWVTKLVFSPVVSQKLKTEVVFFLSALTSRFDAKVEDAHIFDIIMNVPVKG